MTPKQSTFVDEYLVDLNATQAAIRSGYSAKNADNIGYELLGKTGVSAAISARMAERAVRTGLTQDRVLDALEQIKTDAMRQVIDKEGNATMANHNAAIRACELEGKHIGMWNERLAMSGGMTLTILTGVPE